ncbi:hypothetical protein BDV96DRAFT_681205 [Lophiotrema nucula]|uniref:Uncharacterized protein n=1 Tax=Lophiotrema nucula TaxID=690887 RepID=A0A6A5ZTE2_9PLEO|nr:hypothetical protein BDV96DRAFT_681205 [Lophiotrema nucula]
MPLTLWLAVGGHPCPSIARVKRSLLFFSLLPPSALPLHRRRCYRATCSSQIKLSLPRGLEQLPSDGPVQSLEPAYTSTSSERSTHQRSEEQWDPDREISASVVGPDPAAAAVTPPPSQNQESAPQRLRPSRKQQHRRRLSQPVRVLEAIRLSRLIYALGKKGKPDLAHVSARRFKVLDRYQYRRRRPAARRVASQNEPLSLHSILARYIETCDSAPLGEAEYAFTPEEQALLQSKGYQPKDVEVWAASVTNTNPRLAAAVFRSGTSSPPMFIVLLFLRRRTSTMAVYGLRELIRHLETRFQSRIMSWTTLKIVVIRLLRHARVKWPEAVPKIAALFTSQATKICEARASSDASRIPQVLLSDLTHFCNTFLSLLAIPAALRPVLQSSRQQKAQFEVLNFMAQQDPPIIVTRTGFRGVAVNQLAHPKTSQEREWARLKGPGWPPWKENRNALDEDKDHEFGQSRASSILRRMHEAGYEGEHWVNMVQMYAGWDVDLSPSIQTRVALPPSAFSPQSGTRPESSLWASRVRATRTRREAWACFLAYEASGLTPSHEVYEAMFEKHVYEEHSKPKVDSRNHNLEDSRADRSLLPGDKKEVWPDPPGPLNLVYLREPVPSIEQLYRRMTSKNVKPAGTLLTLLMKKTTDFSMAIDILHSVKDKGGGGIDALLNASLAEDSPARQLSDQLLVAFIHFLCRFGQYTRAPLLKPIIVSPEDHRERLRDDRFYLVEYARRLLLTLAPLYRPTWTVYMEKLLRSDLSDVVPSTGERVMLQQRILSRLLSKMQEINLEPDDKQFQLICSAKSFAARAAYQGHLSNTEATLILSTSPRQLRTLFHDLVAAPDNPHQDTPPEQHHSIPPHIPDPATLHAYVRALGMLRDHEGLYSFVQWARTYHVQVTARAKLQHGGPAAMRRTLVAIRAALDGALERGQEPAASDLRELVRADVEAVLEWGGWPRDGEVDVYTKRNSWM